MGHAPVIGQKHQSLTSEIYENTTSKYFWGYNQPNRINRKRRKNERSVDQALVLLPLFHIQPRLFLLSPKECAGWLSNFPVELSAELLFLFLILQSL